MRRAARLLLALALAGCGYHLAGAGRDLPPAARTISIELFKNDTRQVGLEVHLRRAIEEEFLRRGPLRVVSDPEGDLVLSGEIRRFASVPVAFSATDEAVQFQSVVQVSLRVTERTTKRVIRDHRSLQATQDFGAVTGAVVTTSPHYQRSTTLDARDLPNLANVQLGESGRRAALRDLLDTLARDVYLQTMEGF